MMTADQTILLLDKERLWSERATTGSMDLRDYNRRAADALRALFDRATKAEAEALAARERVGVLEAALRKIEAMANVEVNSPDRRGTIVVDGDPDEMADVARTALQANPANPRPRYCVNCGALNADPRPWDVREAACPDCQDGRRANPAKEST